MLPCSFSRAFLPHSLGRWPSRIPHSMRTTLPSVMATGWGTQERGSALEHQKAPSSPPYFGGTVGIKIRKGLATSTTNRRGHVEEKRLERALVESHPRAGGS